MIPQANQLHDKSTTGGTVNIDTDDRVIRVINNGKVSAEYPLPNNFDVINPVVSASKSYIGTTLATASAGLGLDVMIKIMASKKAMHDEGLSRNVITLSNCFSPVSGKIIYDFDARTYSIGSANMGPILPDAVYYFPQGAKVDKFDRIMSNPLDPRWYLDRKYPLEDVYLMFRKEFRSLAGNLTEELFEVLFHLLTKKDFKTGEFSYVGSTQGITKGNNSFFAQLSFEQGKRAVSKLAAGELKFENDIFTRNILDHMIISARDNYKL